MSLVAPEGELRALAPKQATISSTARLPYLASRAPSHRPALKDLGTFCRFRHVANRTCRFHSRSAIRHCKAEGVGFEPTSALRRQQFSRLPRSTTPAPLRGSSKPNPIEAKSGGNVGPNRHDRDRQHTGARHPPPPPPPNARSRSDRAHRRHGRPLRQRLRPPGVLLFAPSQFTPTLISQRRFDPQAIVPIQAMTDPYASHQSQAHAHNVGLRARRRPRHRGTASCAHARRSRVLALWISPRP